MGEIRSALDIALEKTANIHGDKGSGDNRELKKKGKKAAGDFLASGDISILENTLAAYKNDAQKLVKEGAISILLASIRLPSSIEDLSKIKTVGTGLDTLLPKSGMAPLFVQFDQILQHYLTELDNLEKTLEQQFLPRLRAKQQEFAKRYGQTIPMELNQDSEYMGALAKNKNMIESKYGTVIDEIRSRVREIGGIEE